jgi:hypothetical protein
MMKKKVVFEFVINDPIIGINDGSVEFVHKPPFFRIIWPNQELVPIGNTSLRTSKKAHKEFGKFLINPESRGKSIFFYGTYEKKNGVNEMYFSRALGISMSEKN